MGLWISLEAAAPCRSVLTLSTPFSLTLSSGCLAQTSHPLRKWLFREKLERHGAFRVRQSIGDEEIPTPCSEHEKVQGRNWMPKPSNRKVWTQGRLCAEAGTKCAQRRGSQGKTSEKCCKPGRQACLSVHYTLGYKDTEVNVRRCQEIGDGHIHGKLLGHIKYFESGWTRCSVNLEKTSNLVGGLEASWRS